MQVLLQTWWQFVFHLQWQSEYVAGGKQKPTFNVHEMERFVCVAWQIHKKIILVL